jgi:predicted nucleic-acid-binding Zn-ribbon protein
MKNIAQALKAGSKGFMKAFEPGRYEAGGIQVRCSHCRNEVFQEQEALLNTTGATMVNLDWLNKTGTALICENCGLIQWFGKRPERR